MRIANNAMAINTHRQYTTNNANVANATEKLSSGYRINRAGDDAAGLAISEKMRAQIKGLTMASKNSQDAISLVQTAEGALTETHSILQRMRELAVQAASDTNDQDVDRQALNEEFTALKEEIDDIAGYTKFNGKKLLDGSFSGKGNSVTSADISPRVKLSAADSVTPTTVTLNATDLTYSPSATTPGSASISGFTANGTTGAASLALKAGSNPTAGGNFTLSAVNNSGTVTFTLTTGVTASLSTFTSDSQVDLDFGAYGTYTLTLGSGSVTADNVAASANGTTINVTAESTTPGTYSVGVAALDAEKKVTFGNVEMDLSGLDWSKINSQAAFREAVMGTNDSVEMEITANAEMIIQTGADQGEELSVGIGSMTAKTLKIDTATVETREHASDAIDTVNKAINDVSTQRAKLGAYQNRLQHKINNLDTSAENLQAAESRIRDLDMAKEMTNYTKNNILVQASTAMLAQANAAPQGVLQLLQ